MARLPIPKEVAIEVLFASNRTCCVCRIPGKRLQLHHIDGDPSNSVADNLAALCFACHDETQVTGGFGRHLDPALVERHRHDWVTRVRERRDAADRLASSAMAGTARQGEPAAVRPNLPVEQYAMLLPDLRAKAYERARPQWDTGVTATMVQATYDVILVLEDIVASLCTYYPDGHFDVPNPRDYVSELIASRFSWHRYRHEPDGQGKNGTIVHTLVAGSVLSDMERMVEELVASLSLDWSGETNVYGRWQAEWTKLRGVDAQGLRVRSEPEG